MPLNSLFAPPHIAGDQQAESTLEAWRAQRPVTTRETVEQSRILPPVTNRLDNTQGYVDPAALRAQAWGLPYDLDAQRNRIAARIAEWVNAGFGSSIPGAEFTGGGTGDGTFTGGK